MRLVFGKFENSLQLRNDLVNVLRIEDPSLYSRCALSLAQGFSSESLEPAAFFSEDHRELPVGKILYFAGDPLLIDLNDRRIVSQVAKVVVGRLASEDSAIASLERLNYQIEDVLEGLFLQMSGDYTFFEQWDTSKYLKMAGLGIDDSDDLTVFDRVCHFLRVMADLFPDKVIAFVNLLVYLTKAQYNEFCELAVALQLCILLYERGSWQPAGNLENVLHIDENYLER